MTYKLPVNYGVSSYMSTMSFHPVSDEPKEHYSTSNLNGFIITQVCESLCYFILSPTLPL